ncbi:MAG: hypothetical protein ACKV2Q_31065 [Planctomycetaceae bacterium]
MNRVWSFVGLFVAFVFAVMFFGQPAQSDVETKPNRWEYRSETVEPGLLSQRLNEWGNDRWEIFSVERGDSSLEQDGKTRLKVENFQVTARRPLK